MKIFDCVPLRWACIRIIHEPEDFMKVMDSGKQESGKAMTNIISDSSISRNVPTDD